MKKDFITLIVLMLSFQFLTAQEITTHTYGRVAPENMKEFIKREVTYYRKFAEKEIEKGNLTFWALLERVGGENQDTEPNILQIQNVKDIDQPIMWDHVKMLFPNTRLKDIKTDHLITTTATVFLRDLGNYIQAPNVVPEKDYKYLRLNYHNMNDLWWHLNFEAQMVKPFFKKAMDDGKTRIKGWGNSLILTPKSEAFQHKTSSRDYFSTLRDALGPNDFPDMDFPEDFYEEYLENYIGPRNVRIYRVIKVVTAPETKN